ncbi:MAG: DsbC family protein [Gammaproteobacteria bacterium]|nr:MAG: DsbC family protein [Gammaproteobacteria bacterium]
MTRIRFFQVFIGFVFVSLVAVSMASGDRYSRIKTKLSKTFPKLKIKTIRPSPVPGMYEMVVGTEIFYVSANGEYVFVGNLISAVTKENVTQKARGALYQRSLANLDEKKMIIFGPKRKRVKRTVTVFTDIDCPYCAKFHLEVPTLVQHGVRVRYLLYPRTGIRGPDGRLTPTYQRSVAVWCAKDQRKALTDAKAGRPIKMKSCPNPVAENFVLGQRMGLRGTPMIITDKGKVINGYLPANNLLALLKIKFVRRAIAKKTK